jgi:seryl-tRNA synthetase
MLQLNYIRDNKEEVLQRLAIKNFKDAETIINSIIEKDTQRRTIQKSTDDVKAEANQAAKQIGDLMKSGKKDEAEKIKERTAKLKISEKQFDEELKIVEDEIHQLLVQVPNAPHLSVPKGKTPEENEEVMRQDNSTNLLGGNLPSSNLPNGNLPSGKLPHWDICSKYDLVDFELGVKIAGAGFPVYKGKGAKLQRALFR